MATANKEELIKRTAKNSGMTIVQTNVFYEALVKAIKELLKECATIKLVNFGKFRVMQPKEKIIRDFRNGEKVTVPSHKVVKFTASPALNNTVNED
jgi:nucleoid DNA-binding protein